MTEREKPRDYIDRRTCAEGTPGCPGCGKPGVVYLGGPKCSVEWDTHEQWCPLRESFAHGPFRDTKEEAIEAASLPTCK